MIKVISPLLSALEYRAEWVRWLAWVLAAVVAYVVCAAFYIGADPWDPLADWGPVLLIGSSLALGLLGGRWPLVLVPLALIPLMPLSRASEPLNFSSSAAKELIAFLAVLIALPIGVRALTRRRGPRADRRAAGAGAALLCLTSAVTGWAIYLDHRVVDRVPSSPLLIDEHSGAYRGVAPGDPTGRVRRLLGPPADDSGEYIPYPLRAEAGDITGGGVPAGQTWRYPTLVVFASEGRVPAYLTTDPSAQTPAGVGIGDSLKIAKRAYSNLSCGGVIGGSDAVNPYALACRGWLEGGATISFGGDPIDNILVRNDPEPPRNPPIRRRAR